MSNFANSEDQDEMQLAFTFTLFVKVKKKDLNKKTTIFF